MGILFLFWTIFCCVFPRLAREALIYLNPLTQFPSWEEIAGGAKTRPVKKCREGSTSLRIYRAQASWWPAGGTVVPEFRRPAPQGPEKDL